jgi:hypothetical protein
MKYTLVVSLSTKRPSHSPHPPKLPKLFPLFWTIKITKPSSPIIYRFSGISPRLSATSDHSHYGNTSRTMAS